jgi:hypothetical protein
MVKIAESMGADRAFLGPVPFTDMLRKDAENTRDLIQKLNISDE